MSEALAVIPTFSRLSERVWRVLGLNPGKFTLQGTNTYLVGMGPQKLLIDCGEGKPDYIPLLRDSLQQISPQAYISDIIISHDHYDHWGGLEGILSGLKSPIRVHKYPSLAKPVSTIHQPDFPSHITVLPLRDNQIFSAEGTTLRVIHTPGHTKDHCAFWLEEESNLFTADCVLGQGTAVFEDLSDYIAGLRHLTAFCPHKLYPGHGPVVDDGMAKLREYIQHREEREEQIISLLSKEPDKNWSAIAIVEEVYKGYPENLHLAAARGVVLHLLKLEKDNKVVRVDPSDDDSDDPIDMIRKQWRWLRSLL